MNANSARNQVTQQFQSASLRTLEQVQQRAVRNVVMLIKAGHWAGWITLAGGCLVILAYALDIESVWRPLAHGPSTHPITALLFIAGGIAIVSMRAMRTPVGALVLILLVGLTAIARLLEIAWGSSVLDLVSPFETVLERETAQGTAIQIGWNSAAMFVLVAAAFLMRYLGRPIASQIVAAFGVAPPLVALTGYVYEVDKFYGAMSLTTAAIGLCFSSTPFLLGARNGFVRAISSPWDSGRFGRLEIAIICSAIFVGGYAIKEVNHSADTSLIPLFVVTTILIATTTIAFSTIATERNDRERRHAERAISHLVLYDPLSGLYNRRFLKEQEEAIVSFSHRQQYRICVMMIDIDRFKHVNDTFGHPTGDRVIRRVAGALKARLRRTDLAVRYGGEELLGIVLDAGLDDAMNVAEDIRATIAATDWSDLDMRSITVSIGVAEVDKSLTEAIARADVALYLAKTSGRNRVVGDQSSKSSAPPKASPRSQPIPRRIA